MGGDGGWNGRDGEGFMERDDPAAPLDAGSGDQQLSDLSGDWWGWVSRRGVFGDFFLLLCWVSPLGPWWS
jgi:hypothetical protein